MLILSLFAALVNSILPVLLHLLCYDSPSCYLCTSFFPSCDSEIPFIIFFTANLLSLFRNCCPPSWGPAPLLYSWLSRGRSAGQPQGSPRLAVEPSYRQRTSHGDFSDVAFPCYSSLSQAKLFLLLRPIMLNGTEVTFIC